MPDCPAAAREEQWAEKPRASCSARVRGLAHFLNPPVRLRPLLSRSSPFPTRAKGTSRSISSVAPLLEKQTSRSWGEMMPMSPCSASCGAGGRAGGGAGAVSCLSWLATGHALLRARPWRPQCCTEQGCGPTRGPSEPGGSAAPTRCH